MGNTRMRARAFSPLGQTALAPPQLILRNMSCDKTTDFPHDTVPLTPDFPHDTVPLTFRMATHSFYPLYFSERKKKNYKKQSQVEWPSIVIC